LLASQPGVSRRTAVRLLGVCVLGTVAGCRPSKKSDDGATAPPVSPSASSTSSGRVAPPQALADRAAEDERALIAAYDDAIDTAPELEPVLAPLRADHAAHLVGLAPGAPTAPAGSPAGTSATPTPTPSAAGSTANVPSSPAQSQRAQTLSTLAARERAAAAARIDDLMSADGSLARLLASIGGCEASHASLLAVTS
jgi:hypothetical protein